MATARQHNRLSEFDGEHNILASSGTKPPAACQLPLALPRLPTHFFPPAFGKLIKLASNWYAPSVPAGS
jgi:hypothetical protein